MDDVTQNNWYFLVLYLFLSFFVSTWVLPSKGSIDLYLTFLFQESITSFLFIQYLMPKHNCLCFLTSNNIFLATFSGNGDSLQYQDIWWFHWAHAVLFYVLATKISLFFLMCNNWLFHCRGIWRTWYWLLIPLYSNGGNKPCFWICWPFLWCSFKPLH